MSGRRASILCFLLSHRVGYSVALAIITIGVWWYAADYYWMQFLPAWTPANYRLMLLSWGPEVVEVVLTSLIIIVLVLIGYGITRWQIRRVLPKSLPKQEQSDGNRFDTETQRAMLLSALSDCEGLTHNYVLWLQSNVATAKPYVRSAWILLLWLFLSSSHIHSTVIETIAGFARRTPPFPCCLPPEPVRAVDEIFNIRIMVPDVESSRPSSPVRLDPGMGNKVWNLPAEVRPGLAIRENGTFLVGAGDFPHLHRQVVMHCLSRTCVFPGSLGDTEKQPLRAGATMFDFVKSSHIHLNATIVLITLWGGQIDKIVIVEPNG